MRKLATVVLLSTTLILQASGTSLAGNGDDLVDVAASDSGVVVGISVDGQSSKINVTDDPWRSCYVELVPYGHLVNDFNVPDLNEIGLDDAYVLVDCTAGLEYNFFLYWRVTEPVPAVVTEVLARSALARADIIPAVVNASPNGTTVPFLTQLPTWLWVPEAAWGSVSATASIPELGLSVTATVTPETTTWDPGDGSPSFTCAAPTPYRQSGESDCEHVYTSTNEGEPVRVTAVTNYDVEVACSPLALCANLVPIDGLSATHSVEATIQQVRGVITG